MGSSAKRRGEEGQALVEAALIIPILLLFLAVAGDLGRGFFQANQMTDAAREGALFAAHHFATESQANLATDTQNAIQHEEQGTYSALACSPKTITIGWNTTSPAPAISTWSTTPPAGLYPTPGAPPAPGQRVDQAITVTCQFKLVAFTPLANTITLTAVVSTYLIS